MSFPNTDTVDATASKRAMHQSNSHSSPAAEAMPLLPLPQAAAVKAAKARRPLPLLAAKLGEHDAVLLPRGFAAVPAVQPVFSRLLLTSSNSRGLRDLMDLSSRGSEAIGLGGLGCEDVLRQVLHAPAAALGQLPPLQRNGHQSGDWMVATAEGMQCAMWHPPRAEAVSFLRSCSSIRSARRGCALAGCTSWAPTPTGSATQNKHMHQACGADRGEPRLKNLCASSCAPRSR